MFTSPIVVHESAFKKIPCLHETLLEQLRTLKSHFKPKKDARFRDFKKYQTSKSGDSYKNAAVNSNSKMTDIDTKQ